MRVESLNQVDTARSADIARSERLGRAAQEFEAQMMKELLKPMTGQDGIAGEQADGGDGGVLGEYSTEALAQAISRQGGFGIANRIAMELSHSVHTPRSGSAADNHGRNLAARAAEGLM